MKVVFMGTPEFAVPTLEALLRSKHQVKAVVTGKDKRAGRRLKLVETAVKISAYKQGLTVLQTEDFCDPFFLRALKGIHAEIGVVVAFRIIPEELFQLFPHGCINLHPSLLPDLRGAAPINWALMRGYRQTGITTFLIRKKVDAGSILLQETVDIDPMDDAGSLSAKLSVSGSRLVVKTLDELQEGNLVSQPQKGTVTKAPRITRTTCRIDWNRPAGEIHNQVRGLSPVPTAFTTLKGRLLKVYRTIIIEGVDDAEPGVIEWCKGGAICVQTGKGKLGLTEIQLEGRKRITAEEFLRGKTIEPGTKLGS